MPWLEWICIIVFAIIIIGLGGVAWLLTHRPSMDRYDKLRLAEKAMTPAGLRVKFMSTATTLVDDGESAVMIDGFFSRPGPFKLLFGKIQPEVDFIDQGLKRAGVTQLDAVIVNHSHYDHSMDSAEVALRTGALLIGSSSTANIGRGWGLPEMQIRIANSDEPMRFGRIIITLLPSQHIPMRFLKGHITEPLRPPVRMTKYLEGACYAVLIEHEGRSFLINATGGFEPGALRKVHADVVMLAWTPPIAAATEDYRSSYWREVVMAVGAKRVIPIHWDDLMLPAGEALKPSPYLVGNFHKAMEILQSYGKKDGIDIRLPLEWRATDLWEGLN